MESNILENSLIYLLDAANRLNEPAPDNSAIKYALVHLWRGLNLLLKKRLFDEHWSLIYKDTTDPQNTLNACGLTPISFNDLKYRLFTFCNINIVEYDEIIDKIQKDYKKIELSQFTGSKIQMVSNLVHLWPFIVDFTSKHIDFSHDTYSANLFNQTCEIMDFHLKMIHFRKNEIRKTLDNDLKNAYYAKPLKCPECLQPAIPLLSTGKTQIRCAFCSHVIHWKELATKCGSITNYLGPFDCLNCKLKGVIRTEDRWICLSCCHLWELENINICKLCETRLVWALPGKPHCKHCSV